MTGALYQFSLKMTQVALQKQLQISREEHRKISNSGTELIVKEGGRQVFRC